MPANPEPVTLVPMPHVWQPGSTEALAWLEDLGIPPGSVLAGHAAVVHAGLVTVVVIDRDEAGNRVIDPGGRGYGKAWLTVPLTVPLPAPIP